ncbi:hypothetical protein AXG93_4620s1130 [Marchantia polymorpha subsp. ruderalis]|uniref:Uncharacterized protein n=1 Tax=Marchantia polymorpha subsp. ruderalis TaxID=1480154 RepID=A0A176VWW0_MARPO|nr:hypothetical protein AXG93_4620s1130 [Marchantia polymorpha subsp. ruderalis]
MTILSLTVRVSREMELLTAAEKKRFTLQTHAVDEDETLSANEVNTDQEDTQLALASIPEEDASKEAKEKEADTEVETPKRNPEPLAKTIVYIQSEKKSLEKLAVLSDTEEDFTSLEELADPVVEGVERTATEQLLSLPMMST